METVRRVLIIRLKVVWEVDWDCAGVGEGVLVACSFLEILLAPRSA